MTSKNKTIPQVPFLKKLLKDVLYQTNKKKESIDSRRQG